MILVFHRHPYPHNTQKQLEQESQVPPSTY
jgi:hypothetical protein